MQPFGKLSKPEAGGIIAISTEVASVLSGAAAGD
jgi:hypothetical protein